VPILFSRNIFGNRNIDWYFLWTALKRPLFYKWSDSFETKNAQRNTKKHWRSSPAALNIHFTSLSKLRCCIALIKQAEELQTMKAQKLLKNHERSFSWSISYVHGFVVYWLFWGKMFECSSLEFLLVVLNYQSWY